MRIRTATIEDIAELKSLYVNTINSINSRDYNKEQIAAWASTSENTGSLEKRILDQLFIVAVNDDEIITGFSSLDLKNAYLDLMYVHKNYQKRGIATMLLNELLARANELKIKEITSDVSITARPFFEKRGFDVVKEQIVNVKGVKMINFKMNRSG